MGTADLAPSLYLPNSEPGFFLVERGALTAEVTVEAWVKSKELETSTSISVSAKVSKLLWVSQLKGALMSTNTINEINIPENSLSRQKMMIYQQR